MKQVLEIVISKIPREMNEQRMRQNYNIKQEVL
jgi:hypothetical protein